MALSAGFSLGVLIFGFTAFFSCICESVQFCLDVCRLFIPSLQISFGASATRCKGGSATSLGSRGQQQRLERSSWGHYTWPSIKCSSIRLGCMDALRLEAIASIWEAIASSKREQEIESKAGKNTLVHLFFLTTRLTRCL